MSQQRQGKDPETREHILMKSAYIYEVLEHTELRMEIRYKLKQYDLWAWSRRTDWKVGIRELSGTNKMAYLFLGRSLQECALNSLSCMLKICAFLLYENLVLIWEKCKHFGNGCSVFRGHHGFFQMQWLYGQFICISQSKKPFTICSFCQVLCLLKATESNVVLSNLAVQIYFKVSKEIIPMY